jgi:hypothetical protein
MLLEPLVTRLLLAEPQIDPGIFALCIPIAAIVCGSIIAIVKTIIHHRERMAKIGMGIDPDAKFPTGQAPDPASQYRP